MVPLVWFLPFCWRPQTLSSITPLPTTMKYPRSFSRKLKHFIYKKKRIKLKLARCFWLRKTMTKNSNVWSKNAALYKSKQAKDYCVYTLKGIFQMWPGEELSQAAVNRQVLFNPMKQRLWEGKYQNVTLSLFSQKRGWGWKKKEKAFSKIRAKH